MRIRDLGPLLIDDGGIERAAGTGRIASVLAVLAANAGTTVTTSTLIDAVWGTAAPERAGQSLETIIWRLRKLVEPDRGTREAATIVRREEVGYRLALPPGDLDSRVFERACGEVRDRLDAGAAADALEVAEAALQLWRGTPYQGIAAAGWLEPVQARLEESYLDLHQHCVSALLESGHPERAATEAATLLVEHPFRERLWELRMLALYRCGRQADALTAFAEARRTLVSELAVEPGPPLQELHRRMLEQDPALDRPSGSRAAPPAEIRLPLQRSAFVGRAAELASVRELLRTAGLTTITGTGGCGKTRLAIEAAGLERDFFRDGLWFVDLSSMAPGADAAPIVASILGLAPDAGVPLEEALAAFLNPRRALLVFDNCEHVVDEVSSLLRHLLDACPRLTILATSREALLVEGERFKELGPLDISAPEHLPDDDGSAAALFLARLADVRPSYRPVAGDLPQIHRICTAVAGLPLGIELAAAHARTFELDQIAEALERSPGALTRLSGGPQRHSSLNDTIDWSIQLARPDERVLHRRLSVLPGPFSFEAATSLCAVPPLREEQSLGLLSGLVHRSLLVAERGTPLQRFAQLVPVRAHARSALNDAKETTLAQEARDGWMLERVTSGIDDGRPGQDSWFDWLDAHATLTQEVLRSALVQRPSPVGLRLLSRLTGYWYQRERMIDGLHWLEIARDLPFDDKYDAAVGQSLYGIGLALHQETEDAMPYLAANIPVLSNPPPAHAAEAAEVMVLMAAALWVGDAWSLAADVAGIAVDLANPLGLEHVTIRAKAIAAACLIADGDLAVAASAADDVLQANIRIGNHFAAFFAYVTKGIAAAFTGDWVSGLQWTTESLRCQAALGMRNIGDTLEQRGAHYFNGGQLAEAVRCYGISATQHGHAGRRWPRHPGTEERLADLRARLTPDAFERAWSSGQRLAAEPAHLIDSWM